MTRAEPKRGGRDRWAETRRATRPSVPELSRPQRRYAVLLGTACALSVAVILRWGPPLMAWRVGDRPESDVDARVGYQYLDASAKRALEDRAAAAAPSIYQRDASPLTALRQEIERTLEAVKAADSREALPPEIVRAWPLTAQEFQALKSALPPEREVAALMAGVAKWLQALEHHGIIAPDRKKTEGREGREWFTGLSEDGRQTTRFKRDLVLVAGQHEALQAFLEAEAGGAFGANGGGPEFHRAVAGHIARRAEPNLRYDEAATLQARAAAADSVGPVVRIVQPGQVIAKRGRAITPELRAELKREHAAYLNGLPPTEPLRRVAAAMGVAALLAALAGGILWRIEPKMIRSKPRLLVFGLLCVSVMAAARILQLNEWPIVLTPVALVAIALAIAYNQRLALGAAFVLSLLAALATTGRLETFFVFLVASAVGVFGTREVRNRARLIEVGFAVGLACAAAIWVTGFLARSAVGGIASDSLWGLAGGVMTGFVITGGLPFIEILFKITTDISLLELSGANQPLLRRLALETPGTYNHSLVVGSLAEAAAEKVGANGLVARLGSLFHDVGKITKPEYFVENRTDAASGHDGLTPPMSALVIIAHVKDGLEMAREQRVPRVIRDIISQHHGTTLVEYFYHEAQRSHASGGHRARPNGDGREAAGAQKDPAPEEGSYRYPGPKPRTREAAIVMLADAVESASRSMREPTPTRIENLVREIARRRADEGQFDDCGLTFRELATVQATLATALARMYHSRVRYPGQDELEGTVVEHVKPAVGPSEPDAGA